MYKRQDRGREGESAREGAREEEKRSQGGYWIFLAEEDIEDKPIRIALIDWKSWTIKRVAVSTLDAETQGLKECTDRCVFVQALLKWMYGKEYQIDLRSYCESLVKALKSPKAVNNPRTEVQVQSMRDDLQSKLIRSVTHIAGVINPADIFTKDTDHKTKTIVREMMSTGILRMVDKATTLKTKMARDETQATDD